MNTFLLCLILLLVCLHAASCTHCEPPHGPLPDVAGARFLMHGVQDAVPRQVPGGVVFE